MEIRIYKLAVVVEMIKLRRVYCKRRTSEDYAEVRILISVS